MFKTRNAMLLIVAVILVSAVTTAAYFKTSTPATSSSLKSSVNPSVSQSTYMSNQTINSILDQAYEQHRWSAHDQTLLNILNRASMPAMITGLTCRVDEQYLG